MQLSTGHFCRDTRSGSPTRHSREGGNDEKCAIDLRINSCRTKEGFLEETLLKKGFPIFLKLLISYCNLISGNLYMLTHSPLAIFTWLNYRLPAKGTYHSPFYKGGWGDF
jgi:hypothetical protein